MGPTMALVQYEMTGETRHVCRVCGVGQAALMSQPNTKRGSMSRVCRLGYLH
jgi:hypothetical protein